MRAPPAQSLNDITQASKTLVDALRLAHTLALSTTGLETLRAGQINKVQCTLPPNEVQDWRVVVKAQTGRSLNVNGRNGYGHEG